MKPKCYNIRKKTRKEVLAQNRENERKHYEQIKNDPDKLATLKEKKKTVLFKVKKCAAKKSATDFIRGNTPLSLCKEDFICEPSSSQIMLSPLQEPSFSQSPRLRVARQKSVIQRHKKNKEIKEKEKLQAELNKYRKKVNKLRKKKNNLKKLLTPNSKISQMADDPTTRTEVVKKALFGDTLKNK